MNVNNVYESENQTWTSYNPKPRKRDIMRGYMIHNYIWISKMKSIKVMRDHTSKPSKHNKSICAYKKPNVYAQTKYIHD